MCVAVCVSCATLGGRVTASLGDPVSVCDYGILYDPTPPTPTPEEEEEDLYVCAYTCGLWDFVFV